MSLIKRSNSKHWYVQFQLNSKTIVRSTKTTDRRIAVKIASKIRADAVSDAFLGHRKLITMQKALDRWVSTKAHQANAKNLHSHYKVIIRVLGGSTLVSHLTTESLERFRVLRSSEGCSAQTIKHGLNCIMGAIRLAKREGFSVPDIHPPSIKINNGRLRYLSIEEERGLLEELDPKGFENLSSERSRNRQDNYDLIVMLLDTGARYSEIADLNWNQIDFSNRGIKLWRSKVENESLLFMTERVHNILTRRRGASNHDCVFTNSKGGPRGYCAGAIRKAFIRAGLSDCSIHTLRHTNATRLIQAGLSLYEVKAVLGHSDIRTTMRYAHLDQVSVTAKARDAIESFSTNAL